MKGAESVDEAGVDEVGDALAFLVGETGVVVVGLRTSEVDIFVGGIKIAADDDGFGFLELFQIF